jgi:hypothetical protein
MEDLLIEIKRIHGHGIAKRARRSRLLGSRTASLLNLEGGFVRLKNHVRERVRVVDTEEVMVRTCENVSMGT